MRTLHAMTLTMVMASLGAALVLTTGCNNPTTPSVDPNTAVVTLDVEGMTCVDGCAALVRDKLAEQPGVSEVQVDFPRKKATFKIAKDKFDEKAALEAVKSQGFEVKVVK